jgi:methionyl-tRNA synthetase
LERFLITSALPYINGVKHLGNLAGSLLPADVYARFLRLEGKEVLFICATDEHGTPAELSAREAEQSVADYCAIMHQTQASIYAKFGLAFDHFGRTSSPANRHLTQHFYARLTENGYIDERPLRQLYSAADGRFLPDRYVIGTCPHCGYQRARGDQCEQCSAVLDPSQLLSPRSAISGSADLEVQSTRHLFLRLDALSPMIRAWVEEQGQAWPRLTRSIALKWLDEGLDARCITRDLRWGVSVPRQGFEDKVFYVWFDAPIGYIAATQEWASESPGREWEAWWLDAKNVTYTQFMAKDNVPFHTVFFPAMIIGTNEPWTRPAQIKSFNWLTYYGEKFSTSGKRGVFLDAALALFDADYWRYFLLASSPEADDAHFTWEAFASAVNKDLVGIFGNFVNRTLKLSAAQFGSAIPEGGNATAEEMALQQDCLRVVEAYRGHLAKLEFRKAIQSLRALWSLGNVYLDRRSPWKLVQANRDEAALVLRTSINLIRYFAMAAAPIIPFTAMKIYDALGLTDAERGEWFTQDMDLNALAAGRAFYVPEPLFRRIDAAEVANLQTRFAGA